jgi:hypothetical protein
MLEIKVQAQPGIQPPGGIGCASEIMPGQLGLSFANVFAECCLALSPGYSYGDTFSLSFFVNTPDMKPGRYRLQGRYSSSGLDTQSNNRASYFPRELSQLPYPVWKGEIKSNMIWIEILPGRQTTHRQK